MMQNRLISLSTVFLKFDHLPKDEKKPKSLNIRISATKNDFIKILNSTIKIIT